MADALAKVVSAGRMKPRQSRRGRPELSYVWHHGIWAQMPAEVTWIWCVGGFSMPNGEIDDKLAISDAITGFLSYW